MINTLPITIPKLSLQVNNASPTNSAAEYSPRISFSRSISQLSLEYNGTIKTTNKSDDLPNEIVWMIFNYISKSCRRSKSYKDLLYCSRVDKRFNVISNYFIWNKVSLQSKHQFDLLVSSLKGNPSLGGLVRHLSISHINIIEVAEWKCLMNSCIELRELNLERCLIEDGFYQPVIQKELRTLILKDCTLCPFSPISCIKFQQANMRKLVIIGCSFTDSNVSTITKQCPNLEQFTCASHVGSSLSIFESSDEVVDSLIQNCPSIVSADIAGTVSISDQSFQKFLIHYSNRLERLDIKRAMQLSPEVFATITGCQALQSLSFSNVPHLTDEIFTFIVKKIGFRLTNLQLESLGLTDESILGISEHCEDLTQLRILNCDQWESLNSLVTSLKLKKLSKLVIHDCSSLQANISCNHDALMSDVKTSTLTSPPRIRDTSYMNVSTPSSPALPDQIDSPPTNQTCDIAVQLTHLEIIGCDLISQDSLLNLLVHFNRLQHFIYAGESLSLNIRKYLTTRSRLKSKTFILTPSTPAFEL